MHINLQGCHQTADIKHQCMCHGFAVIESFHNCQLLGITFNQVGKFIHQACTFTSANVAPALKCLLSCIYGKIDLLLFGYDA